MDSTTDGHADVFDSLESDVRTYCRRFPAVFTNARGHILWDADGRRYIDLLSGAGALNYGHNDPAIKQAVCDHLAVDGLVHSLDLHTTAKAEFLTTFERVILAPRQLAYRTMFTGPTGANAIEAALKIARRVTGRTSVVAFTGGFHGLSLGALALSATAFKRDAAGIPLTDVNRMPYDGYFGNDVDTSAILEKLLDDPGSGIDRPAAIVLETVQGEGGLATASPDWLRRVATIADERGILLVVDDIQAGCGRTGTFFSFEDAGLNPDIVCLSKSLSGLGLPLAVTLVKPELDQLGPGEHSGTFRGHNLAFVAGERALTKWAQSGFAASVSSVADVLDRRLREICAQFASMGCTIRGRGLLRGLAFREHTTAELVSAAAYRRRLLVETSGAAGKVLKIMPPIVIEHDSIYEAMHVLAAAIDDVASRPRSETLLLPSPSRREI